MALSDGVVEDCIPERDKAFWDVCADHAVSVANIRCRLKAAGQVSRDATQLFRQVAEPDVVRTYRAILIPSQDPVKLSWLVNHERGSLSRASRFS